LAKFLKSQKEVKDNFFDEKGVGEIKILKFFIKELTGKLLPILMKKSLMKVKKFWF